MWDYSTGEPGKLLRSVREHDGWVTSFLFWLVKQSFYTYVLQLSKFLCADWLVAFVYKSVNKNDTRCKWAHFLNGNLFIFL